MSDNLISEKDLTRAMLVGESYGLEEASRKCMALATTEFERNKDDLAKAYRSLANEFIKLSDERHPGSPEDATGTK